MASFRIGYGVAAVAFIAAGAAQAEIPEQRVGEHFAISSAALPAPAEDTAVGNESETAPRPEGALPHVPPGFAVSV
ncbi:MAG: hypothetical protein QOJ54_1147, partial [Aliidongia sp.]|nr:hypothetical protein [Aliidongia sp.]